MGELLKFKMKEVENKKDSKKNQLFQHLICWNFSGWILFTCFRFFFTIGVRNHFVGNGKSILLPGSHPYFHFVEKVFSKIQYGVIIESLALAVFLSGVTLIIHLRHLKLVGEDNTEEGKVFDEAA